MNYFHLSKLNTDTAGGNTPQRILGSWMGSCELLAVGDLFQWHSAGHLATTVLALSLITSCDSQHLFRRVTSVTDNSAVSSTPREAPNRKDLLALHEF
jgi:hypothetical protein